MNVRMNVRTCRLGVCVLRKLRPPMWETLLPEDQMERQDAAAARWSLESLRTRRVHVHQHRSLPPTSSVGCIGSEEIFR